MKKRILSNEEWILDVNENPDWGYARNKQLLLKTFYAEFSSSNFSTVINIEDLNFYGGNRDYSWQGLIIGPIDNILYKIIDGIYYSINKTLKAEKILFNPKQCTYVYSYEGNKVFSVKISLINCNTYVLLKALANEPAWFTILLDFRPAEKWIEGKYLINFLGNEVIVKNSVTPIKLIINGFNKVYPLNLFLNWRYKLGDGFRQVRNGINFIEHYRSIYLPAVFYSSTGMLEMKIPLSSFLNFTELNKIKNETLNFNFGNNIIGKAIKLRLETLFSYGLNIDGVWFPEAGAWWFRKPWVRDALEGLRWNIKTYIYFFNWSNKINSLIQYLLGTLKSSLGLPTTIGSTEFSSDAPPQLLNVACNLAYLSKNKDLFLKIVKIAVFIVETLFKGLSISKTFLNDSILCSSSNSSWIDSIITVDGKYWPSRLPLEWIKKDVNPFESEFGLVEVNAFYIEAFKKILNFCEKFNIPKPECIKEFLNILLDGFIKYFKQSSSLPALTVSPTYNLKDDTLGSPGLIASSILVETVYNEKDLEQLWSLASKKLLIHRKLVVLGKEWQPFGILVKAINLKPYLNDFEYHTTVVWPRDTPYLIKLLEKLNLNVKGLLLSNLDHMLAEGIFGYCSELFSLPIGKNPFPTFESNNPIPVKNPAQYWSHWCDPYIEHLTTLL